MLSRFDDYPIHQTPEPVAHVATSDRNAYDRYWFNGYAADGEFYFGVAMAIYPNLHILDCAFSIVRDGEQHAFHASRRAPRDPSETEVGPFRIEIAEPMRRVRLRIAPNETGIAADLEFVARTACIEEGRQTMRRDGRTMMDSTRFTQLGRWSGEIRYAGKTVGVDAARVYGTKDRSWGVRPVGAADPGGAPPTELPQIFFLWAPVQWKDRCTHALVFEDASGRPWHQEAMIIPAYDSVDAIPGIEDPRTEHLPRVEHHLEYVPGTRRARSAEIALVDWKGARRVMRLEPLLCFRMKGIGYTHPTWGHGHWKGELAVAGESWKTADLDEMAIDNQHVQQVMRATMDGEEGVGVMEQLAYGPYPRYGLNEFLDPAR
ncbi:MAG TPA: hypothetical protein VFD92_23135 [Candidatus Binatia bacterium]|nr:hypothetical protein [Candidatus Binatia bacterium]